MRLVLACALVIVSACGTPTSSPVAATAPPPAAASVGPIAASVAPTPPAAPTAKPKFASGIYVLKPSLDKPGGEIDLLDGTLPTKVQVTGIGFDLLPDFAVYADIGSGSLVIVRPDGSMQRVQVQGLSAMGRVSLSGDGTRAAVQATTVAFTPGRDQNPMQDTIFVVDLPAGTFRRVGALARAGDPGSQSEQPAFFPSGDRVAHWAAENNCLVIKVRDANTGAELLTIGRGGTGGCYQPQRGITDGPRFHVAVSPDSTKILIPGQLQLFDARTGALLADVHQAALDGLAAAGYKPDSRYPGAAGGGTYPLSGALSPDGKQIVFDGAVEKSGTFGVLLCRIGVDGTGFTVLRGPVPVTPAFSNNHNFSQLLPRWR